MKKNTKNQILVIVIAFVMFSSTLAFVITGIAPMNQQQNQGQTQVPDNFVVEGTLNQDVATQLLQRGYSLMEWHYYEGCCADLIMFVEALPTELENQLIVQKISDSNYTWASVKSIRGEQTWNITKSSELIGPLCDVLLKPPLECGLMKFENQSA